MCEWSWNAQGMDSWRSRDNSFKLQFECTEFGKKVLEECVWVAVVGPTYYFYDNIEHDDQQIEMHIGTNGVPRKTQKHLKANTVKQLIRGIKKSLPIMRLTVMD